MVEIITGSSWVDSDDDEIKVVYVARESDKVYYRYTDLGGFSIGDFWMMRSTFLKNFKPKEVSDGRM